MPLGIVHRPNRVTAPPAPRKPRRRIAEPAANWAMNRLAPGGDLAAVGRCRRAAWNLVDSLIWRHVIAMGKVRRG